MTKDPWGRLAGTYDVDHTYISGSDLVRTIGADLVRAMPDGEVVELGCGTGLYTRAYASACRHVLATDVSVHMVEAAQQALGALPNVSVQAADATATGLPSGSADAVVAVNLLHIVPNAAAVLAEARRLLRPAGVLVVADATGEGLALRQLLASGWRILRRWGVMRRQKGQQNLGQHSLEALVEAAGFESIQGRSLRGEVMNAAFVRAVRGRDE